jgi:predicted protein tyrosine phosphatase
MDKLIDFITVHPCFALLIIYALLGRSSFAGVLVALIIFWVLFEK